jgi:hypothetical protein
LRCSDALEVAAAEVRKGGLLAFGGGGGGVAWGPEQARQQPLEVLANRIALLEEEVREERARSNRMEAEVQAGRRAQEARVTLEKAQLELERGHAAHIAELNMRIDQLEREQNRSQTLASLQQDHMRNLDTFVGLGRGGRALTGYTCEESTLRRQLG